PGKVSSPLSSCPSMKNQDRSPSIHRPENGSAAAQLEDRAPDRPRNRWPRDRTPPARAPSRPADQASAWRPSSELRWMEGRILRCLPPYLRRCDCFDDQCTEKMPAHIEAGMVFVSKTGLPPSHSAAQDAASRVSTGNPNLSCSALSRAPRRPGVAGEATSAAQTPALRR